MAGRDRVGSPEPAVQLRRRLQRGDQPVSDTHYKNGVFCAFFDTDNYYEPNRVEGRPDGTAVLTWTQRKEGPCDFLLSANQEYSWTVVG